MVNSGAGKSTLLNIVSGIIDPDKGIVNLMENVDIQIKLVSEK